VVVRDPAGLPLVRALQLTENLLRHDLSPLDEARAYQELMELEDLSAEELARRLHISGQAVRNRLRVLTNQVVVDAIARRQLSLTAGYLLLKLPEDEQQAFLARLRSGERLRTSGVIQARQARLEAGLIHPARRGRGRSPRQGAVSAGLGTAAHSGAPEHAAMLRRGSLDAEEPAHVCRGPLSAAAPAVQGRAQSSPGGGTTVAPGLAGLSEAQTERAGILAEALSAILWRGLRPTEQAEAVAGLREVLASPQAASWSQALLAEVVRRLERARF
jgi:ParB-like chromosome segregation protein Spo0J